MSAPIPVYQLDTLAEPAEKPTACFFLGPNSAPTQLPIDLPYRSDYYKIGLCLRGSACLKVNLETYAIGPNSVMLLSPYVIKQWPFMSADMEARSIFFTKEFITANSSLNLDAFAFFARDARHVFELTPAQAGRIGELLQAIEQKYAAPHAYREEILRSLLHILLHETAPIYSAQQVSSKAVQTRSQLIAAEFKQLVNTHYATERSLAFYANKLCITPKHLAETVKEATGKRAAEWLAEAVLLAAHVLLRNPTLTIGQIADTLHFADQSTFGRFFRNNTGVSPASYRHPGLACRPLAQSSRPFALCLLQNPVEICPMKIIVTGSLGNISQPLTTELVQQGHAITVISSQPAKQAEIEALGATAAIGSLADADFLAATFAGADAVYAMVPPSYTELDSRAYFQRIGRNYAQAIERAGVRRVVQLSSWGAHRDHGTGGILGSHDVEEILAALPDIALTHLRPTSFYTNYYGFVGMIKAAGFMGANCANTRRVALVHPRDIAAAAAEELASPAAGPSHTVRYVASDERTPDEVAHALGAAIGRPDLHWVAFSDEQMRENLLKNGLPPSTAADIVDIYASMSSGALGEDYELHKPALGQVKLEEFAKEFAAAF